MTSTQFVCSVYSLCSNQFFWSLIGLLQNYQEKNYVASQFNTWLIFVIFMIILQVSSSFHRAVKFHYAAKKHFDFLFSNWILLVFSFLFSLFSQMLAVINKKGNSVLFGFNLFSELKNKLILPGQISWLLLGILSHTTEVQYCAKVMRAKCANFVLYLCDFSKKIRPKIRASFHTVSSVISLKQKDENSTQIRDQNENSLPEE